MKTKLGILASTRATDLDCIVDAIKSGFLNAEIVVLLSDKQNAYCLERAANHNIETVSLNKNEYDSREGFDKTIADIFDKRGVEYIVCIGYMRLFSSWFVQKYKNKIINIHPSLLPKYPGMDLNVHKAVLAAGEKVTGCTAHFIDEGMDTGAIILQKSVGVQPGDTPEKLKERVQWAEQQVLPEAIKLVTEDQLFQTEMEHGHTDD